MSKPKKKVVVTTTDKDKKTDKQKQSQSRASRSTRTRQTSNAPKVEMVFGRQTYIWFGIGAGLVTLGLILMSGGHMPNPDVWEPERIYSFRRTVLAPVVILGGLGVVIYAIFKK